jgi:hypothetical protein
MNRDIVVTWPKKLRLDDYLRACAMAAQEGQVINYRVSRPPSIDFGAWADRPGRCYIVYDGLVRGYQEILYIVYRSDDEVLDSHTKGFWPAGWYIVRNPEWHPVKGLIEMQGFQGWRWWREPQRMMT